MHCPRCGSENSDNRSACWSCFAQLDSGPGIAKRTVVDQPEAISTPDSEPVQPIEALAAPAGQEQGAMADSHLEGADVPEWMKSSPLPGEEHSTTAEHDDTETPEWLKNFQLPAEENAAVSSEPHTTDDETPEWLKSMQLPAELPAGSEAVPSAEQHTDTPPAPESIPQSPAASFSPQIEPINQSLNVVPELATPAASDSAEETDYSPWKTGASPNPQSIPAAGQPATPPTAAPPSRATAPNSARPLSAPDGVNWGGFLLPFFWSFAHKAWLWMAISFFCLPVAAVYLLIAGNKVAWENRQFASLDEFKKVQKAWTIWGLIIVPVGIVVGIIIFSAAVRGMLAMSRHASVVPMNMPPGMQQNMPMPSQGGAAAAVTPYYGSTQAGSPTNGTDAGRPCTTTAYTAQAGFEAVFSHFKTIAQSGHNYSASSSGTSADILIGDKTKIQIESKGPNQTSYTITEYK